MKAGDIVQVVRTDCERSTQLIGGMVGEVIGTGYIHEPCGPVCPFCRTEHPVESLVHITLGSFLYTPRSWLKRFPSAEELGIVNETDKVTA